MLAWSQESPTIIHSPTLGLSSPPHQRFRIVLMDIPGIAALWATAIRKGEKEGWKGDYNNGNDLFDL